jgi:cyanate permease
MGLLGAGASVGPLLLGPHTQWAIDARGWAWALIATALLSLLAWPLAAAMPRRTAAVAPSQPVADVLREWRFWRVALSFGVCGFHVAFLATHMATLPPTSALVARQHGVARLGTLFGVVMLVHQLGAFAGIGFGGWAAERTGSDTLLWAVDIALALGAAALAWRSRVRTKSQGPCLPAMRTSTV